MSDKNNNKKKLGRWWTFDPIGVEYSSKEEIINRKKELTDLFDLNFGKDWRVFQNIYYNTTQKRHNVAFKRVDILLDKKLMNNIVEVLVMRKAYFGLSRTLLRIYFNQGLDEAIRAVKSNHFRAKFKDSKGKMRTYSPSDKLFCKLQDFLNTNNTDNSTPKIEEKA